MTDYIVDEPHILRVENSLSSQSNFARSLTRVFNFQSRQVTTIYNDWIVTSSGSSVSSQMHVQNFSEVESQDEIRAMHRKLKEQGGDPGTLDVSPLAGKSRVLGGSSP